jgi:hypothetical protein
VRFRFKNKKLEALYTKKQNAHKYPGVVDDFFEVMAVIAIGLISLFGPLTKCTMHNCTRVSR